MSSKYLYLNLLHSNLSLESIFRFLKALRYFCGLKKLSSIYYLLKKNTKAPSKALQTTAGGNLNGKSSWVKISGFIIGGGKLNSSNSLER